MRSEHTLGDDPVNTSGDELDRRTYADHAVRVLNRVRRDSESSVVALVGPWGSGKSSVLEMIKESIDGSDPENNKEWRIAEFNPWIHSDPLSMYVGFYTELRACMPAKEQWKEGRERLGSWIENSAPLGKLGGIVRVDLSSALEKLAEKVSGDVGAAAKKERAEEALRDCGVSVLVVMDDLDRLTPDELLEIFKLVRLVGRLPNVYYLLAYDEQSISDVLCRTELAFGQKDRARNYMEKMVQVRLDLPALRETQSADLVDSALTRVCASNSISLTESEVRSIAQLWHGQLKSRLTTPRSIHRFFSQVDASFVTVAAEVSFTDFIALTFLRTNEPKLYSHLSGYKDELTMRGQFGVKQESHEEKRRRWLGLLKKWEVEADHQEGILGLLADLFLPIKAAVTRSEYGSDWLPELAARRAVGHPDYFDRYFSFGVPSEDISDRTVAEALEDLADGRRGTQTAELSAMMAKDPQRVVTKIQNTKDLSRAAASPLLEMMGEKYLLIPNGPSFLGGVSRIYLERLATELLESLESNYIQEIDKLIVTDGGYCLAVRALSLMSRRAEKQGDTEGANLLAAPLKSAIEKKFHQLADSNIETVSQDVFATVHLWLYVDRNNPREFFKQQVENGRWPLLEILGRMVDRGTVSEGATTLMALSLEHVEATLGIAYVLDALEPEVSNASTNVLLEGLPDTPENRRAVALAVLRFEQVRRSENS
ncbi:P-loop NTPase fold protein [Streptomyces nojiriensis]|uniref:KAP family P-loop NTPase fold protein n=1 Tax=Streptomyces nojiriensis TaxID=66374 RepID=UPI00364976D5